MTRTDRIVFWCGALGAALGTGAGVAEIFAGTVSWAGEKNDPTTLGLVTIGLGVLIGAAGVLAVRSHRPATQLAAVVTLFTVALLGLTTAGLVWIPAAVAAFAAGVAIVRLPREARAWRAALGAHWAPALVGALGVVYLTFGIVSGGLVGLLGILGATGATAALVLRRRSRLGSAVGLVVAVIPFAAATTWAVVTPATAILMLAIGLPHALDRPHNANPRRKPV